MSVCNLYIVRSLLVLYKIVGLETKNHPGRCRIRLLLVEYVEVVTQTVDLVPHRLRMPNSLIDIEEPRTTTFCLH